MLIVLNVLAEATGIKPVPLVQGIRRYVKASVFAVHCLVSMNYRRWVVKCRRYFATEYRRKQT